MEKTANATSLRILVAPACCVAGEVSYRRAGVSGYRAGLLGHRAELLGRRAELLGHRAGLLGHRAGLLGERTEAPTFFLGVFVTQDGCFFN